MADRITLRPIVESNWEKAALLEVLPEQKAFIYDNVWSIAEAKFHQELQPMAIMLGSTMVGFLMWGIHPHDGKHWLLRFMIDRRWQGQGLGGNALSAFLELARNRNIELICVGFHPDNHIAEKLYLKAGFELIGMADWGEMTARKTL